MSNKLQLTQKALNETKDLQAMFELDAVRHNAIMNHVKTTGRTEEAAAMHYEREKILFFKALSANNKIEQCDRFSVYSSWVELMVSGATLNEGNSYLIPYGKKLQFQMGWRGRLEQMVQIPVIVNIPPPQVVYENDEFDYELGERPRIIKHKPAKQDRGELFAVYLVIQKESGFETHLMLRDEVLQIRNTYSKPYIQYVADCKAAGKNIGDTFTKRVKGWGGKPDWDATVEPPMWVSSEAEAWKKTIINRCYKWQPKTARMKALDERIKDNYDPETATGGEETNDIDFGFAPDDAETTDKTAPAAMTVTPAAKEKEKKQPKQKAPEPEPRPEPTIIHAETVDTETGEVNPAEGLPDLNDLDSY